MNDKYEFIFSIFTQLERFEGMYITSKLSYYP